MRIATVFTDQRCALHDAGPGHPERPERLAFALDAVADLIDDASEITLVDELPLASRDDLCLSHTIPYVDRLLAMSGTSARLDLDTAIGPHSIDAGRLAAAGAIMAADAALSAGPGHHMVCVARPPGHHAESACAMGFCLFNNAAIAAAHVLKRRDVERVMIFDPDVHHGNGTQEILYSRADVFYLSLHRYPWYPWSSGGAAEIGLGAGEGFTANVPLPAGSGDDEYGYAMRRVVLPLVEAFSPHLLITSAGFDAHASDPLGGMGVSAAGYEQLFGALAVALVDMEIPAMATLEGGYTQQAIRDGVHALLAPSPLAAIHADPTDAARRVIDDARARAPLLS